MTALPFEQSHGTDETLPSEVQTPLQFSNEQPIDKSVDIHSYEWQGAPEPFLANLDQAVAPLPIRSIILPDAERNARVARECLNKILPRLPQEVRESFSKGAGMFEIDPGEDDFDGLYE